MPFKYGIATVTALPHLFVRAEVEVDGKLQPGVAAENLPPKWFTKDPTTTFEDDVADMLQVIDAACGFARDAGAAATVFEFWRRVYDAQAHWAQTTTTTKHPPLLWSFGVSLIERAVIDAFCRATGQTFAEALRTNSLGVRLGELHRELDGAEPSSFLPREPLRSLGVRHTVGLSDPLTDSDIPPNERLDDGLPQSLEACVAAYGLTHFKIKLGGDVARDVERLRAIGSVLAKTDVRFTLDGNENYHDVAALREMWGRIADEPFMRQMIVLEQPLHRDVALSDETARQIASWNKRPAMIIDESDDRLDSAARALDAGYVGTSYKSCKGVFKGIANACLMARRKAVITAEDLSTVGPVSLMQDLAVVAALGISHVERNGHHYFRGLSAFGTDVQRRVLEAHGDLYRDVGFATLRIAGGRMTVDSVIGSPFGVGYAFDPECVKPVKGMG
jgi:hypothetical protein